MASETTPGPWVDHEEDGCITAELTADGNEMPEGVCLILAGPHAEANAALIMAAPELLAEAERFLEAWDNEEATYDFDDITSLRGVIAKARGES